MWPSIGEIDMTSLPSSDYIQESNFCIVISL